MVKLTPTIVEHYQELFDLGKPGDLFKDPSVAQRYEQDAAAVFGKELAGYDDEIDGVLNITTYSPDDTIVDLGCGTGLSTRRILEKNPRKVIGIDFSEAMLAEAGKKFEHEPKIELKIGNAEELSDLVQEVDKVVSVAVFKYFPDLDKVLPQIYAVLKPEGEYVFSVPIIDQEHPSLERSFLKTVEEVLLDMFGKKVELPCPNTGQEPKYAKQDLETKVRRNGFTLKVYKEVPLAYSKNNLMTMYQNMLTYLEAGLEYSLSDKQKAQEITTRVREKLEHSYREDKEYVFGKEAYVCLVKR
ncbi:class I SAM-dependent methyltransferase [Candidatus Woesearchaeota archaeon]|nr:class I SAM-dependent methyltransferase [Candidatus Woesearchaeota archaeon]